MTILIVAKRRTENTLRENLEEGGFSTIGAQDGPNGLKQFVEQSPDLVILDPSVEKGKEFIEQIRAISSVPLLTVLQQPTVFEVVKELETDGVDCCLRRPINSDELLARVRRLLHRSERAA